jgi:hypothetical protein
VVTPRSGPCSPWVSNEQLRTLPDLRDLEDEYLSIAAEAASDTLYRLSGSQFTGEDCGPVTIRPLSRPVDADDRTWGLGLSPLGYFESWGSCSVGGYSYSGVVDHWGCSNPPEIDLGAFPVTTVTEVKIDGVVIPSNEYQLQDFRRLTRMRPSAAATPTDRWGWPTCQQFDLPDTEENTFSVTYTYGQPPPALGVLAAKVLAKNFALSLHGDPNDLPIRMTSISREGISAMVTDSMDFLSKGQTGIYEVDLFLRTVNPSGQRRQTAVWSPDLGRARRNPS